MTVPRLGQVQLQIMRVLWDQATATARSITETLNQSGEIAHSTVQTLLRKLEKKGAVSHDVDDRTFVYRALVRPDEIRKKHTREFVDRLFEGSAGGLVAYLLEHERIPSEELQRIRDLIESASSDLKPENDEVQR